MDYRSAHSHGCRLMEYFHRSSRSLSLENELLKAVIWVDKGTDIVELHHKKRDVNVLWTSSVGIRDIAQQIPTCATARGNNNDYYPGGWHGALPGGGAYAEGGNLQGLHGEVTLMLWCFRVLDDTPDVSAIEFRCKTVRMPLRVTRGGLR